MKFEVQHCIYFFLMRVARGVSGQGMEAFKKWLGGGQMGAVKGMGQGRWGGRRGGQKLTADFGQA